jgi:hypothetical protein
MMVAACKATQRRAATNCSTYIFVPCLHSDHKQVRLYSNAEFTGEKASDATAGMHI